MKQFTLGKYTLDDFAQYLNGNNDHFVGIEGNELLLTGEHNLSSTLNINIPLTITGDNATLLGSGKHYGISITSSNVLVSNIRMKGFAYGIEIDAHGKHTSDIELNNVEIDVVETAFDIGSTLSGSYLSDVRLEGCAVRSPAEYWEQAELSGALCYTVSAARSRSGVTVFPLSNCVLEDVVINNCKKVGQTRSAINLFGSMGVGEEWTNSFEHTYSNSTIRGLRITNNHIDTSWDGALYIMAGWANNGGVTVENVEIANNYLQYGIVGLGVLAHAPLFGKSDNVRVANVDIHHNHIECGVDDVGEPAYGINITTSRSDYFPGLDCTNGVVENINIHHNKIEGAGITLTAANSFLDGQTNHIDNVVRDVTIQHNEILSTDRAFQFLGVHLEGRLYDWNFGYPRHDKKWGEPITDDSVATMVMTNNRIENVTCTDNSIEGYRYRVVAAGAYGHGHGICTNNKVCGDIVFENNHFGVGENHLHVADMITDDFVFDGGGNRVDMAFKTKK